MPPKGSRKPLAERGGVQWYPARKRFCAEMKVSDKTERGDYRDDEAQAAADLQMMRAAPTEEAVQQIAERLRTQPGTGEQPACSSEDVETPDHPEAEESADAKQLQKQTIGAACSSKDVATLARATTKKASIQVQGCIGIANQDGKWAAFFTDLEVAGPSRDTPEQAQKDLAYVQQSAPEDVLDALKTLCRAGPSPEEQEPVTDYASAADRPAHAGSSGGFLATPTKDAGAHNAPTQSTTPETSADAKQPRKPGIGAACSSKGVKLPGNVRES